MRKNQPAAQGGESQLEIQKRRQRGRPGQAIGQDHHVVPHGAEQTEQQQQGPDLPARRPLPAPGQGQADQQHRKQARIKMHGAGLDIRRQVDGEQLVGHIEHDQQHWKQGDPGQGVVAGLNHHQGAGQCAGQEQPQLPRHMLLERLGRDQRQGHGREHHDG